MASSSKMYSHGEQAINSKVWVGGTYRTLFICRDTPTTSPSNSVFLFSNYKDSNAACPTSLWYKSSDGTCYDLWPGGGGGGGCLAYSCINNTADTRTSSTNWVNLGSITMAASGNPILLSFNLHSGFMSRCDNGPCGVFRICSGSSSDESTTFYVQGHNSPATTAEKFTFFPLAGYWINQPPAGTHTYYVQWRRSGGSSYICVRDGYSFSAVELGM